jgi:hypothetical protein
LTTLGRLVFGSIAVVILFLIWVFMVNVAGPEWPF